MADCDTYKMFGRHTNKSLLNLLNELIANRIRDTPENYRYTNEIKNHEANVSSTHLRLLNKSDLLSLIYSILYPEIIRIDNAKTQELPLMINEEWSCPELKERLNKRMRGI